MSPGEKSLDESEIMWCQLTTPRKRLVSLVSNRVVPWKKGIISECLDLNSLLE